MAIILRIELGATAPALRAANATLPRIVPAPRRPVARTPVSWTLTSGAEPQHETRTTQSA